MTYQIVFYFVYQIEPLIFEVFYIFELGVRNRTHNYASLIEHFCSPFLFAGWN